MGHPKKVVTKNVPKPNSASGTTSDSIGGSRFQPLTSLVDGSTSNSIPIEVFTFSSIVVDRAEDAKSKEKRKRSPTHVHSVGRTSSFVSPPMKKILVREEKPDKDPSMNTSKALLVSPKILGKKEVWQPAMTNSNRLDGSPLAAASGLDPHAIEGVATTAIHTSHVVLGEDASSSPTNEGAHVELQKSC